VPEIAATKSAERHMTIARTSLRLRQPKNAPDDWELRQLQCEGKHFPLAFA
jgi:hypothetical protein